MVLNALRHHRGRHAHGRDRDADCRRCAQRLAASQRSALPAMALIGRHLMRAQRLAASQRSAPADPQHGSRLCRVLNALRHHRGCGTARSSLRRSRLTCAQRLAASQRSARPSGLRSRRAPELCSTPCGITEVGTRPLAAIRPCVKVLNALRHHRGWHEPVNVSALRDIDSAQRLAASQRSAPVAAVDRLPIKLMCSTPCGITEVGTCDRPQSVEARRGAQRLAASQRSALDADGTVP